MNNVVLPEGYDLRGARPDELQATVAFAESVFVTPREYFLVRYRLYPGALAEHSRLVLHGDQIVSHHRLYQHDLQMAGSTVKAWAIGDVCTHPDHRRKHLGNALLEDSVDYVRARGAALVLIRAGLFAFYGSCGWDRQPLPALHLDVPLVPATALAPAGYITRSYEAAADLWPVAEIHRQYCAGRSLVRVRDGYYWDRHRDWCSQDRPQGFTVAERGSELVAYGRLWDGHIVELCHAPGEEQGALAVLGAMVRTARAARWPAVRGSVPADSATLSLATDVPGAGTEVDEYTLVRIVSLRALFQQTLDSLSARLRAAKVALTTPIEIRCNGESVTLAAEPGYLRLQDGAKGARPVSLTQRQMLDAFSGLALPSDALQGATDAAALAELDALFPKGNPIYWNADTV